MANTLNSGSTQPQPISTTNTNTNNYYKVKFKDYSFSIPDNMMYKMQTNEILISNEEQTWIAELGILDGNFITLKSNISVIQGNMNKEGCTAKPAELKTINGVEVITLEFIYNGVNYISTYYRLNSINVAYTVTYTQNNDFDYSVVEKMVPIISSAEYKPSENGMLNNVKEKKLNQNTISELAK